MLTGRVLNDFRADPPIDLSSESPVREVRVPLYSRPVGTLTAGCLHHHVMCSERFPVATRSGAAPSYLCEVHRITGAASILQRTGDIFALSWAAGVPFQGAPCRRVIMLQPHLSFAFQAMGAQMPTATRLIKSNPDETEIKKLPGGRRLARSPVTLRIPRHLRRA